MPWVKLDDQFPDHPKVVQAGPLAAWLHVCGIAYCNRHLTDGFIPRGVAHRLTDFNNIGLELGGNEMVAFGEDVNCEWMAGVLVDVGLWRRVDAGYEIHDYLDYQPSKAEVEAEREQKRQAGSLGGKRSAEARARARAEATAQAGATASASNPSSRSSRIQAQPQAESKPVPVPGTEEGQKQEGLLSANRSEVPVVSSLPVTNELQISKLLSFVGEQADEAKTAATQGTIRGLCRRLPEGALAKVLESAQMQNGRIEDRAAYVVGALKSEIQEREKVTA